ncbi:aminotransferase class I/II-fold pyridoxal phosphate-dependent enzyme [Oscillatoria sp. FACHB-1406]|uniref:aminotransferase class I/II-fold pyridoxal phosphate-dependent enzyme n=1 Tax=Oscillatoria sp. FACHB-1406 TaxID=2692846 RepID=UPI001687F2F4|nr:DegT/DnrJ/EryC1/StrS family aminotransferase [Oscillatoria sp. FACHB-1406]
MKQIPPLDLTRQYEQIRTAVETSVLDILQSGRYIGGAAVAEFEQQFADYTGTTHCIGCNSGTDALYLALRALEIGAGDEVITTPFTFFATAEVITRVGATPVFVDIDESFNLDLEQIEAAITPKTKAIMPVHLFGQPVDMTRLMAIAEAHNLAVIEDCAQATGAEWAGQKVGSIGHIGCFSFFPTKNLGACGDGGAVTTNDSAIAARVRMLKEHGMTDRYHHEAIGLNSRLDALQAAILTIKLRHLDAWNQGRDRVATRYQQLLRALPDVVLPQAPAGGTSAWNQYTIRLQERGGENLRDPQSGSLRARVRQYLQELGISSMVYYPIPLHLQTVYQQGSDRVGQFPRAERAAREVLSLPMFPELSLEEQQRIAAGLKDCLVASEVLAS